MVTYRTVPKVVTITTMYIRTVRRAECTTYVILQIALSALSEDPIPGAYVAYDAKSHLREQQVFVSRFVLRASPLFSFVVNGNG